MQLLVSVRSPEEAEIASTHGADIVDLKEPENGSLGQVSNEIAMQITRQMAGTCQLSIALGELKDHRSPDIAPQPCFQFAKTGLSGFASDSSWKSRWANWRSGLGPTEPVMVCYADYHAARSPSPRDLIEFACQSRPRFFLIDTFVKNGSILFDHLDMDVLDQLLNPLRQLNIGIALAGSLNESAVLRTGSLQPDIVAVRGAACQQNDRTSSICPKRVQSLAKLVKTMTAQIS